jgi:exonuclease III
VKFDQLTKTKLKIFNQTPKLTENFDQLKMSSEIRSSDHSPCTEALLIKNDNI